MDRGCVDRGVLQADISGHGIVQRQKLDACKYLGCERRFYLGWYLQPTTVQHLVSYDLRFPRIVSDQPEL